jgi:hypothetical protein
MLKIPIFFAIILLILMINVPAKSEELAAMDIFDAMIHYDADQLSGSASIRDYHCRLVETTIKNSGSTSEIVEKDLYFMVPTFQLQLVADQPVFYFDDDLLIVLLESVNLQKLRDTVINDIPCYVIQTVPKDPAFTQYNRIYYVAKDDFRHVRTVAEHATLQYDNLSTVIDYTYDNFEGFVMLSRTVTETCDENDNLLANITTDYVDYEFGTGLTVDFFINILQNTDPHIPLD